MITCHLTSYRASRNQFCAISFHDHLHYCEILLVRFSIKIVLNIISSLRIVFSLCALIVLCLNLQSLVTDVDEGGWCGRVFCSWFRCFRELPFVYFSGVLSLICLVSTEILVCENQTIWRLEIVLTRIVAALLETNAMAGLLKTKYIKKQARNIAQ